MKPADALPRPFYECAHAGCVREAVCRVKNKTGWAWLCRSHYETQHQAAAKAYAEEHNLRTPSDHLAHIKALMKTPKQHSSLAHWQRVKRESKSAIAQQYADEQLKRYAVREREPGEDDEESYANEPMLNA